jgi:hypothetical protein
MAKARWTDTAAQILHQEVQGPLLLHQGTFLRTNGVVKLFLEGKVQLVHFLRNNPVYIPMLLKILMARHLFPMS